MTLSLLWPVISVCATGSLYPWDAQRDTRRPMRGRRSSSRDDGLVNLVYADTRYDEDSYTRNSETCPPCRPADNNHEEQTEQQNQPQCNHSQRETQDIRIVTWERIDFAGRSFSYFLL